MSKSKLYLGSIDLKKINKDDVVTQDKDGKPFKNGAKYLNVAIFVNDEADQYGNQLAVKAGKKDESYYIGNAKEWQKDGNKSNQTESKQSSNDDDDDLPF